MHQAGQLFTAATTTRAAWRSQHSLEHRLPLYQSSQAESPSSTQVYSTHSCPQPLHFRVFYLQTPKYSRVMPFRLLFWWGLQLEMHQFSVPQTTSSSRPAAPRLELRERFWLCPHHLECSISSKPRRPWNFIKFSSYKTKSYLDIVRSRGKGFKWTVSPQQAIIAAAFSPRSLQFKKFNHQPSMTVNYTLQLMKSFCKTL